MQLEVLDKSWTVRGEATELFFHFNASDNVSGPYADKVAATKELKLGDERNREGMRW